MKPITDLSDHNKSRENKIREETSRIGDLVKSVIEGPNSVIPKRKKITEKPDTEKK